MKGLRAVLFDVDFTIAKPGPLLGPEGYRLAGERHGFELDPDRYEQARRSAFADLRQHPELDHDEQVWVRLTEDILLGMGAQGAGVREAASEIVRAWERFDNFELYEDVLPTFERLRGAQLRLALVSNSSRDLQAFSRHFDLRVDAWVASGSHGKVKPSPTIFQVVLELLELRPEQAVMVGDSLRDDVEGARALGMQAVLVDRGDLYPQRQERLRDLWPLPALLGL